MLLKGRRALIAGATSEIGWETAKVFAEQGAKVALAARRVNLLKRLASEIAEKGGKAVPIPADLTRRHEAERVVKTAREKLGGLDTLVSYVGAKLEPATWYSGIDETNPDKVREIMETDFFTALNLAQAALPIMSRQGGVAIFTSSTPAITWYQYGAAYSLAKLTIIGLMKAIAAEYKRLRVRAFVLALGNIKTRATYNRLKASEKRRLAEESPMKRWGEPREVASVAAALASDLFSYVNGQVIVIDGGTVMLS
ncbi:MAG: SDR family oxidoreductase [Nitrososphaerota archaeon]|nr:SDR family oxidoreductase [Candidatus Calditenuaceae archaeon]MDW8073642.1 SDR family oxidoreductase [Nitrososphaerota archaeon]